VGCGLWLLLLTKPSQAAERQILQGHVPEAVRRFNLQAVGRLRAEDRLNIAIGLPLRNKAAMDHLLADLYDPASPSFHRWRTPEQLAQQFGATEHDCRAIEEWAQTSGLTVTATHPNRLVLDVEGSVAHLEEALHMRLQVYNHPSEPRTFYGPDSAPTLDVDVPVISIGGLDNYALPRPMHRMKPLPTGTGITAEAGGGPGGTYAGADFRAAYVPGITLTGSGQSVGLLQFDGYYATDIANYRAQFSLPDIRLVNVPVDGGVPTPGGGNTEVCLDIEMVMSMAPGVAAIYVYEAPNPSPWVDLLSKMQTDNLAKSLSCSWCGASLPSDGESDNIFRLMAAQGQSFFNASGDSGAFVAAIPFPCDNPNITLVGGTTLTTSGSAGDYVAETVWQSSSGGVSDHYGIPGYQQGISLSANQGSTTMRNVPDVSLTADNVRVRSDNGGSKIVSGTSCAAPLWAGLTALVNEQAAAYGQPPIGFLNPALYRIAQGPTYAACFHDITTGGNTWNGSPNAFYAAPGYDLCSGWGTPKGIGLINVLAPPPAGIIWVDFNYARSAHDGSTNFPYSTLTQAVANVAIGGDIFIVGPGSSSETLTISKPMTVLSIRGTTTVGQ
jgi:subtilase family serine protease